MAKNIRFWEIDSLRGIAIIMMIVFHFLFDLNYFAGSNAAVSYGFWLYFARATATIFIFLVGVSLTLSYSRATKQKNAGFLKYVKRGLKIFSWGLLITLITWIFLRNGFIIFGVLHFIGISIILAYPFIKRKYVNLLLGIILIAAGIALSGFTVGFKWLLWLGFVPKSLYTLDYFPILPWFGVTLLGLFFGNLLYKEYKRNFKIKDISKTAPISSLSFLGQHSLLIYLLHQPVLIALLYILRAV